MEDGFQGAEVLETKINSLFFEMIEKVHSCNGFVGTFAGDALTLFFEQGRKESQSVKKPTAGLKRVRLSAESPNYIILSIWPTTIRR